MKTIVIDGNNFDSIETFWQKINQLFAPNDPLIGTSFDGFNDVLRGGWGVIDEDEPVTIIWRNSEKSRKDLGKSYYEQVIRVITDAEHQEHITLVTEK
jgi:RNAse (barnase) inhibitor barstar